MTSLLISYYTFAALKRNLQLRQAKTEVESDTEGDGPQQLSDMIF